MKKRYFVTGSTGFIGANIVRTLLRRGDYVSVLSRKKSLNWRLSDLKESITVYEGDLLRTDLLSIFKIEKPSIVIHCASYGAMPQERDVNSMIDMNIKGLYRLIQACKNTSVEILINTGSSSEYGIKQTKMNENNILSPINDYAVTKAAGTLLCQKESINSDCCIVTLRLFSPYGYFEQPTRFIPSCITSVLSNMSLQASNPLYVRDFVFIEDVVQAYICVAKGQYENLNGEIINIGSGKQHSLHDVVKKLEIICNQTLKISWNSFAKQNRQIESKKWEADISRAKELLHWSPKYSLDEGLEKTVYWRKMFDKER